MNAVKAGNIDQMGLLFERHHRNLFGFFYNLTQQASHSEDLVQAVFYRMMKYKHNFRGEGQFTTWMYSIARNVWIDEGKKSKHPHEELNDHEHLMADYSNRESRWEEDEEQQKLRLALQRLDEEQREVLVMSKLQQMKYQQIAHILNCSEGNVKVKVFRAMKALKEVFHQLPL